MKYKVIIKKFCIMTVAMSLSLCTISTSAYAGRNDKKANVGAEKNNNQNNNNKKNNNQNNNACASSLGNLQQHPS